MSRRLKTIELCYIAMATVFICISAWIGIPGPVPFTMQTFGIFVVLQVLGGKNGLFSILLYIILGLIGLPVFSNFTGGLGVIYSASGGFILGFILLALIYCLLTMLSGKRFWGFVAMIIGLFVCYTFGAVWYAYISGGMHLFYKSLYICVLPFVIPDILKLVAAKAVADSIKKHIKNI